MGSSNLLASFFGWKYTTVLGESSGKDGQEEKVKGGEENERRRGSKRKLKRERDTHREKERERERGNRGEKGKTTTHFFAAPRAEATSAL